MSQHTVLGCAGRQCELCKSDFAISEVRPGFARFLFSLLVHSCRAAYGARAVFVRCSVASVAT